MNDPLNNQLPVGLPEYELGWNGYLNGLEGIGSSNIIELPHLIMRWRGF